MGFHLLLRGPTRTQETQPAVLAQLQRPWGVHGSPAGGWDRTWRDMPRLCPFGVVVTLCIWPCPQARICASLFTCFQSSEERRTFLFTLNGELVSLREELIKEAQQSWGFYLLDFQQIYS